MSRRMRRLVAAAFAGAVLLAGVVLPVHLVDQHRSYGVWGWSPSGATPALPFEGRHYRRTGPATEADLAGLVTLGTVPGGQVLGPPRTGHPPTVLVLRLNDGTRTSYSLSGSP